MAEAQLDHDDVDLELSFEYEMDLDQWDGLMLTEWFDADPGASLPRSSRQGEYFYAHENPEAWDHFDRDDITVEAAKLRMTMEAQVQDTLTPRFNPYHDGMGKFASKAGTGTAGGKSGGTAVKERPARKRISSAEARGNSRPVSEEEYDRLADAGDAMLAERLKNRAPIHPLNDERTWNNIKEDAYSEALKSWGGATIDPHTGKALPQGVDRYAITIKRPGMDTISVREHPTPQEFHAAMDQAKERYRSVLENQGSHLGVFHDDENNRIDIDPVLVVDSLHEVEAIGAATYAIGGAYHFKSGDGFWPPHVEPGGGGRMRQIGLGEEVHWLGPGDWHTYAVAVQSEFKE